MVLKGVPESDLSPKIQKYLTFGFRLNIFGEVELVVT